MAVQQAGQTTAAMMAKPKVTFGNLFMVMMPLYKLINIYFWRGFFGPFFSFVFPILVIGLQTTVFTVSVAPGVVSMAVSGVGVNGLSQTIVDFKKSVLMKRIGATPIRPWMFVFVIVTYMVAVSIVVTFWSLLWIVIFNTGDFQPLFAKIHWGSFLFASFYTIILSCIMGMFTVSIAKSVLAVQVIGIFLTFPQYFFSGQFLPLNRLAGDAVLDGISHVAPFRYPTAMYYQSWQESSFSNFGTDYYSVDYSQTATSGQQAVETLTFHDYDRILNFIMPIVFLLIFGATCIKFFKWSTR